jgi:plasmid stabilization system protein ParE
LLAEGPLRGHAREDLTKHPLRFWTVQPYPNHIIVYHRKTDPLQIIPILHGTRIIAAILSEKA